MNEENRDQERSLSVQEVASRLGVAPITVYRHLKRGTLASFRFGGQVRVLEGDLQAFIHRERRRRAPAASPSKGGIAVAPVLTLRERIKAWFEIVRPFSWTASLIPVVVGGAIAWKDAEFSGLLFVLSLLGALLLQVGTNVINELFDVQHGVDRPESAGASKVLIQGRLPVGDVYRGGLLLFGAAVLVGAYLITVRGYPIVLIGLAGVLAGYFYTAPPLHYKYRALGIPMVFLMMGPLMVLGTYFVLTGSITVQAAVASIPVGILVAAILHANDVRDVEDDARVPIKTLSTLMGQRPAGRLYLFLIAGTYALTIGLAAGTVFPLWTLACLLSLPPAGSAMRTMWRGIRAPGDPTPVLATIDVATAKVHLLFGLLLGVGFILERAVG